MNKHEEILEDVALETGTDLEELGLGEEGFDMETDLGEIEGAFEEGELGDFEGGFDLEDYEDLEADEFFKRIRGGLKGLAKRIAPVLKKVAPIAGKVIGGAFGGPAGAMLGGKLGGLLGQLEQEAESFDGEQESDTEDEMAATTVPGLTAVNDALAEELGGEAAETESEEEAQALGGGVTVTIATSAPVTVRRVTPVLARGTTRLIRVLRRVPQARPVIKAVPTIVKKTVATLSRKAAKGKPITARTAVRTMAKQAVRTLRSPQQTAAAMVRNTVKRKKLNIPAVKRAERLY